MSEEIFGLKIILFGLCILGGVAILIFALRIKWNDEIDYDRIIRELNEQKEKDLEKISRGNKEIDKIEKKILACKSALGFKLFK